jgi:outer membrane protein TolC
MHSMNFRGASKRLHAIRRRRGPIAHLMTALILLPLCAGCWLDHFHRKRPCDDTGNGTESLWHYYSEVGPQAGPYDTGVELEIPMNPPPLTARDPEAREKRSMTLREAIQIALDNSTIVRQIRGGNVATAVATAYDPAIAETRIQQELARFDTSFFFNLFWGKDETPLNSNVAPGGGTVDVATGIPFIFRQDTFGGVAGRNTGLQGAGDIASLRKLLATGGELNFGFNTDYTFSNVPATTRAFRAAYDTRFTTSFRQPLLQQWGVDVNRAPIIIARLQADKSLWDFKQAVSELIRDVEQKYWELVVSEAQYQALNKAIELNAEAVERLTKSLEEGQGTETDLNRARQQKVNLERERTNALAGGSVLSPARQRLIGGPVLQVERQLRSLLGLPPADGKRIVPTDEPLVAPVNMDWYNTIIDAYTYNPEIQGQKVLVAARRQAVKIAADGLKPRLDAFVKRDFVGLGGEFDDSIRQVFHDGFGSWTYGLQFQYTFGYQAAAAEMQRRRLELDQERDLLRVKAQEIEHTLADQYTQVDARYQSWLSSLRALEIAEDLVADAKVLYDAGRERSLDAYLESLQRYFDAVTEEVADRAAFQIALVNIEVTKGTIFKYNNIHVHEDAWPSAAYSQAAQQAADRARALHYPHSKPQHVDQDRLPVYGPLPTDSSQPYGDGYGYGKAKSSSTPETIPATAVETPGEGPGNGAPVTRGPRKIDLILPAASDLILPTDPDPADLILPQGHGPGWLPGEGPPQSGP